MKVGDLVRVREEACALLPPDGRRYRPLGVIVSAANDARGHHSPRTRYWEIMWTDGLQVVLDEDLEVINENR